VVLRTLIVAGLAWAMVACGSARPSPTVPPVETVVASWTADDGSIVALNVVIGRGTDRRSLPDVARRLREAHPGARVIVTVFADTAGPERYVIGHVPTADEPLVQASRPATWLATFDFRRDGEVTASGGVAP
jgi:hypothetical protein